MSKIGIDARMIGTQHGGIGRYIFELVKGVLAGDQKNEYYIFCNAAQRNVIEQFSENKNNLHIVNCEIRHYSFGEQTSFLNLLNKHNLDLVHFPNFNVPVFYKRPFVVTIHDMVHHKISGHKKSRFLHFLAYKKVMEHAAKQARAVITVSQASKKDIIKYLKVLPRKVEVVYEGAVLNTQVDKEKINQTKKKFFLHRPYFLFVGVLERKKNLINLTRGFDYLISKYQTDMDLVVAGKADSHYPEIRHKAMDIKNRERLVFTDYLEDSDLAALYAGAYGFSSASLHEGFGLPGLEAMKFGLPLAVSNTEVFNEIYDQAAVYFNPLDPEDIGEKLYLLARDQGFYSQLRQKSLNRAGMFDWDRAAAETLKIYKDILE